MYNSVVVASALSDHHGQQISIYLKYSRANSYTEQKIFSKTNLDYYNYLICKHDWKSMYDSSSTDEKYNDFLQSLTLYYNTAFPKVKLKLNTCKKIHG